MTKVTAGIDGGGNDAQSADIEALGNATATSHSSTKIVVGAADDTFILTGTGFADFNDNGIPSEGTVTGIQTNDGTKWADFSISVSSLYSIFQSGDVTALDNAVFGGNDEFVSRNTTTSQDTDDVFNGYAGNDTIDMQGAVIGAFAEVGGGDGNDVFEFASNFDPTTDKIDGGAGTDELKLNGDYTGGLVMTSSSMVNVEKLIVYGGHSYDLVTNDANVGAGDILTVYSTLLHVGDTLTFNGSNETDGRFVFDTGPGINTLTGGAGSDKFEFTSNFNPEKETLNGSGGTDELVLNGDYSGGLTFQAASLTSVEKIVLDGGHSYDLTTNDANVVAGGVMTVNGTALGIDDSLTFNGSAETDGRFILEGGKGNDTLTGGTHSDKLEGGVGADQMNAGGGHNIFLYTSISDSPGTANDQPAGSGFDTITGFNAADDQFALWFAVTGVDAEVTSGQLRQVFFDDDMSAAINGAHLAVHHAVLFTPTTGDYDGKTFLIIEANGVAGYQSGGDLVIELNSATHLTSLSTSDFGT
jgi:Ca2+-binding RTX toxin-like protein